MFFAHIRNFLPKIINEIGEKIKDCEDRLHDLGPALPADSKEKMHLIWEKITEYTSQFKNTIMGKYDPKRTSATLSQDLNGGAVIRMMYRELYSDHVENGYKVNL